MINIDNETRKLSQASIVVGYKQENKAESIEFTIPDYLKEYGKKICFKTRDGKVFSKMFDNITSNIFTFTRTETQYGELDATIQFFRTGNEDMIVYKTSMLHIIFKDAVICEDEISPDEPKIPILEELIEKVTDLNTTITENEEVRNNNENTRISNENVRIANEKERIKNENTRIENEEKRNKEYSGLTKRVDNLESDTKLIKCQFVDGQASGNSIHIEDSSNMEMNWKIKGGHRQKQYKGYNLFHINKNDIQTSAWLDYDENKETFIIKQGRGIVPIPIPLNMDSEVGTEITVSFVILSGKYTSGFISLGTYHSNPASWQGKIDLPLNENMEGKIFSNTVTITNTIDSFFPFLYGSPTIEEDIVFKVQLTKSSEIKPYEPYTGGISSPNPGYPQEIETVRGNNVNLLNNTLQSQTINGIEVTVYEDKSVKIVGVPTESIPMIFDQSIHKLEPGTYTLKDCSTFIESEENYGSWDSGVTKTFTKEATLSGSGFYRYCGQGENINETLYPMLVEGSKLKPYVPYRNKWRRNRCSK